MRRSEVDLRHEGRPGGGTLLRLLDPDAKDGPSIERFSLASGRLTTLLRLPGKPDEYVWGSGGFAVSPDERSILYEHIDGRDADIMLVEGSR